jgi:prolyl oligopeptidase
MTVQPSVGDPSSPPATRVEEVVEEIHGQRVVDPYRWLEDGDSQATRDWVAAQNHYARSVLDPLSGREAIRSRLDQLLTTGSVGTPRVRGGRYFYSRRDGRQDQPVLVLREGVAGPERTLLDPNTLSTAGLVSLDWWFPSEDGKLIAYGLSEGGDEWSTLRILDVDAGANLPGEEIPQTRACSVAWLPDGSGFYYTRYPQPGTVPEGEEHYYRHVFLHHLGTDWTADEKVFGEGRAREDWPGVDLSSDGRWLLVEVAQGWARSEILLLDRSTPGASFVPVHAGVDAWADGQVVAGQLFLRSNEGAPNYRLYRINPEQPAREHWTEIIPERTDRVLNGVRVVAGRLVAEELVDATSRVRLYTLDGVQERDAALPSLGSLNGIGGEWDGTEVFLGFTSFAQPASAYRVDPVSGALEIFASGALPPDFDPARYAVKQVWFASRDGTQVPMFVIHRADLSPNGECPTVLSGYGGFNVSNTPAFSAALPLWLDAGGVYAVANLRGGGEFGEAWHQAGMLANKQNVFDDFIGAGEWLIANGYTGVDKLAISGGSNGGLLVGAALVQRPDLFKAVVCRVPLLDMLRYQNFRVARLWIAEYGSAEDAQQFPALYAYSPYHHVEPGTPYPAAFLLTAEGDSRVDPMHARKMAARLQAANGAETPILLRVETAAGHGVGKPRGKVLDELEDIWSFLFWQLGASPAAPTD